MDATELRIGNLVSISVLSFGDYKKGDIYQISYEDFVDEDAFDPIPITEEWFERWGYEHHTEALAELFDLSVDHLGFHLDIHVDDWLNVWQSMSVHQFQNWWSANTGEELTSIYNDK